jgi:predicted enzyme related to lactoylglutathione lyase
MEGLLEWHLSETFGVQVFAEPDRAGRSAMVLNVPDVTAEAARLTAAGITHDGPQDATTVRILPLTDADGNRLVFTSPLR